MRAPAEALLKIKRTWTKMNRYTLRYVLCRDVVCSYFYSLLTAAAEHTQTRQLKESEK